MSAIPTAQDVTTSGGVWAPTSAKRDKLGELQAALEDDQRTLDDAASPIEKHDLWLCDGLSSIAGMVDHYAFDDKDHHSDSSIEKAKEIVASLDSWWESSVPDSKLAPIQFDNMLQWYQKEIENHLTSFPPAEHFRDVRDFFDVNTLNSRNPRYVLPMPEKEETSKLASSSTQTSQRFESAVLWYRLVLAQAAAETMQSSWKTLTTVSDQDLDRAAVEGKSKSDLEVSSLPADKVQAVLKSFLAGTASDRVDRIWDLMDRDQDGRVDETEMVQVCDMAVAPVRTCLEKSWNEAIDASLVCPVEVADTKDVTEEASDSIPKLTWRQRRREAAAKRKLTRTFKQMLARHFSEEVEQPHRLRCIYAWANKMHQDNMIESVLVESDEAVTGFSGRKRYVELRPKIRLDEFREVQQEHFTHLDRVGVEFMKSFREDLWVIQGKGRESKELWRDSAIFMTVVCITDFAIMVM